MVGHNSITALLTQQINLDHKASTLQWETFCTAWKWSILFSGPFV